LAVEATRNSNKYFFLIYIDNRFRFYDNSIGKSVKGYIWYLKDINSL